MSFISNVPYHIQQQIAWHTLLCQTLKTTLRRVPPIPAMSPPIMTAACSLHTLLHQTLPRNGPHHPIDCCIFIFATHHKNSLVHFPVLNRKSPRLSAYSQPPNASTYDGHSPHSVYTPVPKSTGNSPCHPKQWPTTTQLIVVFLFLLCITKITWPTCLF